jgi:ribosome biogenesis GTPase
MSRDALSALGWQPFFEQQLDPSSDLVPARIVGEERDLHRLRDAAGERPGVLAGRLRHELAAGTGLVPAVGDWVLVPARSPQAPDDPAPIQRVLRRRSAFSRQAAGRRTAEQVVAANIDRVFLVQSLNRDLNPRRLERYLALLWESGAEPVVILSKADLCEAPDDIEAEVRGVAHGVTVCRASAVSDGGMDGLRALLEPGRTVALVGSSGVGKSTILNALAGHGLARVQDIREDDRGRHTTTSRNLVVLPGGAILIDTPGMRTVILWGGAEGLNQVFDDIRALSADCRFRDCRHDGEPGCAVAAALEAGTLEADRFRSYRKLEREARHHEARVDTRARLEEQRKWKVIHRAQRARPDKRTI